MTLSKLRSMTTRTALSLSALALASAGPAAAQTINKPNPTVPEGPGFTMKDVKPYSGDNKDIYRYLEAHKAEGIANMQRWLRQQSVTSEKADVTTMAEMLVADLKKIGFQEAEVVPTGGNPGVWGYYNAGAKKTVAIYMMTDTKPVNPADWKSPPFEARLVEDPQLGTMMIARGALNTKGPERAFLNTLEAIIATRGKLPVNIMLLDDNEEEIGSPHYPELIEKYRSRLSTAVGAIYPTIGQSAQDGTVKMSLGNKGMLGLELEARGNTVTGGPMTREVHSSVGAISDSPTWRLIHALATLTTPDGNTIAVPGYYDAVRKPNADEAELVNGAYAGWAAHEQEMKEDAGIDHWYNHMGTREAMSRYLFDATMNIDGLKAGYQGPGPNSILPHMAIAKLDLRLVPDQRPDELVKLIRDHLRAKGFGDIIVHQESGYPASQTAVHAPIVQSVLTTYKKYGYPVNIAPRSAGSAPTYVFTSMLKIPHVAAGVGNGGGAHAPNEYMLIDPKPGVPVPNLIGTESFYADMLYAVAQGK